MEMRNLIAKSLQRLMACTILMLSTNSFAQNGTLEPGVNAFNDNVVWYEHTDTYAQLMVKDGANIGSFSKHEVPAKLNGEEIFRKNELTEEPGLTEEKIADVILKGLPEMLDGLPDDTFQIYLCDVVIDKQGRIACYSNSIGISHGMRFGNISSFAESRILDMIRDLVKEIPARQPGRIGGEPVPVLLDLFFNAYEIRILDHQVTTLKLWDNKPKV